MATTGTDDLTWEEWEDRVDQFIDDELVAYEHQSKNPYGKCGKCGEIWSNCFCLLEAQIKIPDPKPIYKSTLPDNEININLACSQLPKLEEAEKTDHNTLVEAYKQLARKTIPALRFAGKISHQHRMEQRMDDEALLWELGII